MTSLGLMMGSISHGIKGLLTGLDSGMYLLSRGFVEENDEQIKEGWEVVQFVVERIKKVVLDILYYAKERELQIEVIPILPFLEEIAATVLPKTQGRAIDLKTVFDSALGDMEIDPAAIRSGLANILDNAVEACMEDSSKESHRILFSVHQEAAHILIEIEDDGIGMDKVTLDRLFTLFFSSKGRRGTGLGLFIANQTVKEHGGTIRVESEPGKGSRFLLRLPKQLPESMKTTSDVSPGDKEILYCA